MKPRYARIQRRTLPTVNRPRLIHLLFVVSPLPFAAWLTWWCFDAMAASPVALQLGVGVTLLLAVHELGHVLALRRFGIPASPPAFIPFLGALILSREIERRDAATEAWVGVAGPLAGTAASYFTLVIYVLSGHDSLLMIVFVSLITNAFSLLPVPPLDGGRAIGAVTPWLWVPGIALLAAVVWWLRAPIGAVILIMASLSTASRLRMRSTTYYDVRWVVRIALLGTYLLTVTAVIGGFLLCGLLGEEALGSTQEENGGTR